jgi:Zn-dependent protease
MTPTRQGSLRLFRFAGIDVFLHWSWFVVAWIEINSRGKQYSSLTWNVLEYLSLFLIVLMHEFGHSLACRQVGGQANQIVLWPLGGVAYVDPPQRPGATLWSIAAGPLVNVVLLPILLGVWYFADTAGWPTTAPDGYRLLSAVAQINIMLLAFNILPIYPLDGGQILRSLLWFFFGRIRSLMIAAIIGLVGIVGLLGLTILALVYWEGPIRANSILLVAMFIFLLLNCWRGLMVARAMSRIANAPRRQGYACPNCHAAPPLGAYWICAKCRTAFDTFATQATCPGCGSQFAVTRCVDCGASSPITQWGVPAELPPRVGDA